MKRSMLLAVILLLFVSSLFAVKGTGTITTFPSTAISGATGKTFTWTYTSPNAFSYGYIAITKCAGWTDFSYLTTTAGGCLISATNGVVLSTSVTADVIEIWVKSLVANTGTINVVYGVKGSGGSGVTVSSTPGWNYFGVYTDSAGMTANAATSIAAAKVNITALTPTKTITKTTTPTATPTKTVTKTVTRTHTTVATLTATKTITLTITKTTTPTDTPIASATGTKTNTPVVSATFRKTITPTFTITPTHTALPYTVPFDSNGRSFGYPVLSGYAIPEFSKPLIFAGENITITPHSGKRIVAQGFGFFRSYGDKIYMSNSADSIVRSFDELGIGACPVRIKFGVDVSLYIYSGTTNTATESTGEFWYDEE